MNAPLKKYVLVSLCLLTGIFVIDGFRLLPNMMPFDDSYILLQYAKNFIEHFSIAFNAGTSDAGLTSPLYMLLLSATSVLNGDPFSASFILGKLFYLLDAMLLFVLARHLCRSTAYREWAGFAAAGIWLTNGMVAFNSISGMETVFFTFMALAFVCYYLLDGKSNILGGLLAGGLVLTRPDGWLLVLPVLSAIAFERYRGGRIRSLLPLVTALALVSIPWGLYCFKHNGTLFPNTVIAKVFPFDMKESLDFLKDLFSSFHPARAWFEQAGAEKAGAVQNIVSYIPWVLFPVFYFLITRKRERVNILLLYMALHAMSYFIKHPFEGETFRYFIFDLAVVLLFTAVMIFEVAGVLKDKGKDFIAGVTACSVTGAMLALQLSSVAIYQNSYRELIRINYMRHDIMGTWIKDNLPRDEIVGLADIGAIKYISGCKVFDLIGLLDPSVIEYRDGRMDELIHRECDYVVDYTDVRTWGFTLTDTTQYARVKECPTGRLYKVKK